jgi:CBS domain-containing protein
MKEKRGRMVADVMTRDPVKTFPETNLLECARIMVKKKVGSVILADQKKFIGIIVEKDILWALTKKSQKELSKIKAIDISPKKIITISPTATIHEAIQKMKKYKYNRLPVVQGSDLAGMITARDILSFNPELYSEFEEIEQIREEQKKMERMKKIDEDGFDSEGVCDECGIFETLYEVNSLAVCDQCRKLLSGED